MSEKIALGFCNNVDYEIVWDSAVLDDLVIRYKIDADEPNARSAIYSERDLIVSMLGYMKAAEGGERFVARSAIIEQFAARFEKNITLGGTSVRAAIAMRKLGHTAALHLITQNEQVRRLIPSDNPYVCSNEDDTLYPHLIVQFGVGDRVCAGAIDIRARASNRLIYHCNADRIAMKINPDFADLISGAQVLLISGFNAMQDKRLLADRLATVSQLLDRLPADATVFFEDGGYYDASFRQVIYGALGGRISVHSMNEDELQDHLKREVDLRDAGEARAALADLRRIIPAETIVLHTGNWALAQGEGASRCLEALRAGVTMATTRFRYGDEFTVADYREIANRAPSAENGAFASAINSTAGGSFCCVPVADVEQANATTIGLGDAFVGGFLPALLT